MKKLLILLITFILLLNGSYSYKELTDTNIVLTLGINKSDNKYIVIAQSFDISKSKDINDKNGISLYKSYGNTIKEALDNMLFSTSKNLYIGHIKALIIHENVFKIDNNIIDFILNNSELEHNFMIFITKDNIDDIMNNLSPLSIPGEKIYKNMNNIVSFDTFLSNVYTTGIDPVLPVLTINKKLELSKELAIFKKDKLVGYIDKDAYLGLNILNNNTSNITINCNNKYINVDIDNIKSNLIYTNNNLNIYLDLSVIFDESKCDINTFNNNIRNIIKKTIDEEISNNVDYLGIEKLIYQNNYTFYKNNKRNIFDNLNVNIYINTNIIKKSYIREDINNE